MSGGRVPKVFRVVQTGSGTPWKVLQAIGRYFKSPRNVVAWSKASAMASRTGGWRSFREATVGLGRRNLRRQPKVGSFKNWTR